jgi:hypothetical protein
MTFTHGWVKGPAARALILVRIVADPYSHCMLRTAVRPHLKALRIAT